MPFSKSKAEIVHAIHQGDTTVLRRLYFVYGDWVISRHDGDRHYVSCHKLVELYGVPKEYCVLFEGNDPIQANLFKSLLRNCPDARVLRPLEDGHYKAYRWLFL